MQEVHYYKWVKTFMSGNFRPATILYIPLVVH